MIRAQRRRAPRGATPSELADDNAGVIALWCLRILVRLGGHKEFLYQGGFANDEILQAIGLDHLRGQEIEVAAVRELLDKRLDAVEAERPELDGPLAANLAHLAETLGLSPTERLVLAFATLMGSDPVLDDTGDTLGPRLTRERFVRALAVTIDVSREAIERALAPQGALLGSGLCTLDPDPERMAQKLRLINGLGEVLTGPLADAGALFDLFIRPGGTCQLTLEDYTHLSQDLPLLQGELGRALRDGLKGCNILLYGPSGTGKTQLARALAAALGTELFEVRTEGTDLDVLPGRSARDQPLAADDRIRTYRVAQRLLAQRQGCLILFDEIEDVFPTSLRGLLRQSPPPKAWVNDLLEHNPVPTLWVSNSISQLDPALVRRFSLVIELGNPTRRVRQRMLKKAFAECPVRRQWLERMAENEHLSPALIAQAGQRAANLAGEPPEIMEQTVERILGNTLQAMGLPRKERNAGRGLTGYRIDCLNPDQDLVAVAEGLRRDPRGRIYLYGPPGTGKTAFGGYLARTLDRPLLVKRASDLLSMWLGATERLIAQMFGEAERENAVLLLDEADSFLRERAGAQRSWEVTQVNELLTQMEGFDGLFIAATNLVDTLDAASLRRFDLKVRFDYLRPEQTKSLFVQVLSEQGVQTAFDKALRQRLGELDRLTPGDFATVIRRYRITGEPWTPEGLLEGLRAEHRAKPESRQRPMGFTAPL